MMEPVSAADLGYGDDDEEMADWDLDAQRPNEYQEVFQMAQ